MENDQINIVPPIQPEPIPVQLKPKTRLIILLAVLGVVIAGYFVSAKYFLYLWPFRQTTIAPTISPNSKATSDWATYKHPEDGWQILYPKNWTVEEFPSSSNIIDNIWVALRKYTYLDYKQRWAYDFFITVYDLSSQRGKDELASVEDNSDSYYLKNIFQNRQAYIFEEETRFSDKNTIIDGYDKAIAFIANGRLYEIEYSVALEDKGVVDEIINTFQPGSSDISFSELNVDDYNTKVTLRNSFKVVIDRCRYFGIPLMATDGTERLSVAKDLKSVENFKNTTFYKNFVATGCFDYFPATGGGFDGLEFGFPVTPDYTGYTSDGTNWEANAKLQNINDLECEMVDNACTYRVRNGQVESRKK